ncbi:MAG: ABC transporter ATP-binding protein [Verrucomicrobiales bacterium]
MALLKIEQLRKSFSVSGAKREVIRIDRFEIADREECALAGSSGSGKSTFLNLIAGILTADSGRVIFDGKDVTTLKEAARDRWRAENIGYVFQSFNLLQGYTCLENVLLAMSFGRGVNKGRAEELLDRVGLSRHLRDRPRQLSWGQQQRVAVARALANRPKLVLADEPTGNLDARNSAETLSLIRETCRDVGAALLLVSHDRDVLAQYSNLRSLAEINQAGSGS